MGYATNSNAIKSLLRHPLRVFFRWIFAYSYFAFDYRQNAKSGLRCIVTVQLVQLAMLRFIYLRVNYSKKYCTNVTAYY